MAGALTMTKAQHYPALPPRCFPEFLSRLVVYRSQAQASIAPNLLFLTDK
jgi:hypothetical protein